MSQLTIMSCGKSLPTLGDKSGKNKNLVKFLASIYQKIGCFAIDQEANKSGTWLHVKIIFILANVEQRMQGI